MSRWSALGGLLRRGGDEAAQATDDAAKAADEPRTYPSFEDDPYSKRLLADAVGRGVDTPARIATEGGRTVKGTASTATKGLLGGGALYVGNEARKNYTQMQMQESREATYEEFQAGVEEIRNNDNLSAEEKQEQIEQLREAYEAAQSNPDNPEDGGIIGSLSSKWGSLGMVEKTITGLVALLIAQHLLRRMN